MAGVPLLLATVFYAGYNLLIKMSGAAEIGYFYLFGGVVEIRPIAANVAIPIVVSGAIVPFSDRF
jgi:hypothetical protein